MIKISVILCVYNGAQYLSDSISSILAQTMSDFEFIIVDDGSTDDTISKILEFKDERIILKRVKHGGLTKALNQGLSLARGKYIARMDADDIAFPNRFEKQVGYLEQHSKVACVGTAYEVLFPSGQKALPKVPLLTSSYQIKKTLPRFNPFMHGSVMMRREVLEEIGYYDERFKMAQDYDLWFRMAQNYELANLNDILMLRREGKNTLVNERRQNFYGIKIRWKAIQDGTVSPFALLHIIRPFFVVITPIWLKKLIRQNVSR